MRRMQDEFKTASWFKKRISAFFSLGRFGRDVTVLAGGTALGQCIMILASPILTRLYGPDDFGLMAVYVSLLGISSVLASLRYELAIPLPKDDAEAANLSALSLIIVFLVSLLAGLAVWFFADRIIGWVNTPSLLPYLWLLPLGVGIVGTYKVFNYWSIRKQAFGLIARTKINQGLGSVVTQIGLGILNLGPIGLLLGQIVGQSAGITTLAALAWGESGKNFKVINLKGISLMARHYNRFPLFSSWSGVLNTLSVQVPTLMLAFFYGPEITGLYALSQRLLSLPMQFVGQAIAQVFFPTAVEANRNGSIAITTESIFKQLTLIGAPAFLLIGLAAPELFAIIFGEEWREAGVYAQLLSPWLFIVFVSSPLSILPSIMKKQRQEALFNMSLFAGRVGALFIGGTLNNPRITISLFAGVSVLCWFGFMIWNMMLSGQKVKHVFGLFFVEIFSASLLTIPLVIVKIFTNNDIYVLAAMGLCGLLLSYRVAGKLGSQIYHKQGRIDD